MVVIYVDNCIMTMNSKDEIAHVNEVFGAKFDMKQLGYLK